MHRAVFASHPDCSRGRLIEEAPSLTRSPFQRDRDRIIHSTAFRRMKFKTQVFIAHEGDHYRTRLTHSLEVAQIARSIARVLELDEDLAEALALAHDLGHPPFGHAGERALDLAMNGEGGFDHNAQSLRVVTYLERRYAAFDGLNLSWEVLEGIAKHNGPLLARNGDRAALPHAFRTYSAMHDLELHTHASAEAQVAAIADDIAYITHDVDDALRAGFLFLDDLQDLPLCDTAFEEVISLHGRIENSRLIHETLRRVMTRMIEDVVHESKRRLAAVAPHSVADIRTHDDHVIAFSGALGPVAAALKAALFKHVYRHERIMAVMGEAEHIVRGLYLGYCDDNEAMPEPNRTAIKALSSERRPRHICDFVAGMTDRFAILEHGRLFGGAPGASLSFSNM